MKILKTLLDTTRLEFKALLFFFVLGFMVSPVMSWQSEYGKNCKEAEQTLPIIWQYLADSYQIDTPLKMGFYLQLCRARMSGSIPLSYTSLLGEEQREELEAWLAKWKAREWKDGDVLQSCGEIMDIRSCAQRTPKWILVVGLLKNLFFVVWVFFALLCLGAARWGYWQYGASFISGLGLGWYTAQWFYN